MVAAIVSVIKTCNAKICKIRRLLLENSPLYLIFFGLMLTLSKLRLKKLAILLGLKCNYFYPKELAPIILLSEFYYSIGEFEQGNIFFHKFMCINKIHFVQSHTHPQMYFLSLFYAGRVEDAFNIIYFLKNHDVGKGAVRRVVKYCIDQKEAKIARQIVEKTRDLFLDSTIFKIVKIIKLKDYISESSSGTYKILAEPRSQTFALPKISTEEKKMARYTVRVPELFLAHIKKVSILGGFQILSNKGLVVYEPQADPRIGFVSGIWENIKFLGEDSDHALIDYDIKTKKKIAKGILLSGRCSNNYFHWLIEYIPRLLDVNESDIPENFTLLVASTIQPQQEEILEIFNVRNYPVIYCNFDECIEVEDLYIPSIPTFHPDETSIPYWQGAALSYRHLNYLRRIVYEYYRIETETHLAENCMRNKKIYLSRTGNTTRAILNESEIEDDLKKQGFEIIHPEKLSFRQQVYLFSAAEVIVSPSGAALANLIFCNSRCKVFCFISEENKTYCMQSNLAKFSGADFEFITGKVEKKREEYPSDQAYLHANFRVSISKIRSALKGI